MALIYLAMSRTAISERRGSHMATNRRPVFLLRVSGRFVHSDTPRLKLTVPVTHFPRSLMGTEIAGSQRLAGNATGA